MHWELSAKSYFLKALVFYGAFFYSNASMNVVEKFYADALRRGQGLSDAQLRQELCSFFIQTIRSYDKQLLPLAEDIAQYWLDTHRTDTREQAVHWFYAVFSLFDGNFGADMDFSDQDWIQLSSIVSASAESLDMHTVHTIMSVIVERHKLE